MSRSLERRYSIEDGSYLSFSLLGINADLLSILGCRFELDCAADKGKKGVVPAYADIVARMNARPSLSDQDSAGINLLAAVSFHAQPFGFAITPATCAASTLLVCH